MSGMYTDWLLIRRAALELDERFRGSKVQDVGHLADGRPALTMWRRGSAALLAFDTFAPTPLVSVETGELAVQAEPGFVRAAGTVLRGMVLASVRSRRGDRMLRLDFTSRSRFGVSAGATLICELVPRFGNLILLKDDTIIAAAKEFSPAENSVRSIQVGQMYEPPPLNSSRFIPKLISNSYSTDEAQAIVERAVSDSAAREPLFVYRRDGRLVQAHIVALAEFSELQLDRAPSILPIFSEARESHAQVDQGDQLEKKRRSLAKYLRDRGRRLRAELTAIEARLGSSAERERLREAGVSLYATLHELDDEERVQAKAQALDNFVKYKKLGNAIPHLNSRRSELVLALEGLLELEWELERAGPVELDDVAQAIAVLEPHRKR
ncbi:MAG: NFACT family protein, partial [Candidatus Eremiobacteraeota bacterium]|nr:NFACT family protein [Candidatus Eremiobacteraeota bacterium]